MIALELSFITGMMLGIEFPNPAFLDEDLKFIMVVDLLIFRIQFHVWKTGDE
jgi:hypothetical protein